MRWIRLRNAIKDGSLIGVRGPPGATDRIIPCEKKGGGKPKITKNPSEVNELNEEELQEPSGKVVKGIRRPVKDKKTGQKQSVKDFATQKRRKVSAGSEGTWSLPGGNASSETSDDHDKDPDSSNPLVVEKGASVSFEDSAPLGQPHTSFEALLSESIDLDRASFQPSTSPRPLFKRSSSPAETYGV